MIYPTLNPYNLHLIFFFQYFKEQLKNKKTQNLLGVWAFIINLTLILRLINTTIPDKHIFVFILNGIRNMYINSSHFLI